MNCPNCQVSNQPYARFCNNCGTPLQTVQAQTSQPASTPVPIQQEQQPQPHYQVPPLQAPASAPKKGGCLQVVSGIVAVIVVIIFLAGIFGSDDDKSGSSSSPKPTATPFNLSQFKASANTYSYQELARNPDRNKNEKMVFAGNVIQVLDSSDTLQAEYRIDVSDSWDKEEVIYVTYKRKANESRILEGDDVRFWGTYKGLLSYEAIMGQTITIPHIDAVAIEMN